MRAIGADAVVARGFVALAFCCAATRAAGAQQLPKDSGPQGQSGLVTVDSTSFWIDAPHGWVLDTEAGRRDGAIAVLYRQGESWKSGDPVVSASVITPKSGFNAVVPAAVRSDSARWAGQVPDLVFAVRDSVRTVSGVFARICTYRSASRRRYETVAYMQADARVWMLTLSAGSVASYDAASADFVSLVTSYAPGPTRHE
jgi:hypothetical protein